jgi:hypothetical protein
MFCAAFRLDVLMNGTASGRVSLKKSASTPSVAADFRKTDAFIPDAKVGNGSRPCGNANRGFDVRPICCGEYRAALCSRNQSVE